jgi:hypothetical protein
MRANEFAIRALWTCVSPLAWALHRMGICSYKWVNICTGARRPDLFDPLWHYRHYGTPILALPDSVNLCGILYQVAASEGIVTFLDGVSKQRITFERDDIEREPLWYLDLSGRPPAPHVRDAYEWVCAVFGGSFQRRAASVPLTPNRTEAT